MMNLSETKTELLTFLLSLRKEEIDACISAIDRGELTPGGESADTLAILRAIMCARRSALCARAG